MRMMLTRELQTIQRRSAPVFRRDGIRKASVFGSVARGDSRKRSDVDILVDVPRGMDLFEFSGLRLDLQDALKKKVDLVTFRSLHHLMRDAVLEEQKVIYGKAR